MMEINSRIFGQICIDDSKVLHFVNGIVGFPQLTEFALIHDQEKRGASSGCSPCRNRSLHCL